ncbi:hypothetical protein TTHERM_000227308 (macronuclear) [Tetrahymena thermophila SB210]|uniref:Uncharacterized protein n=1 Tax=Tetrahymena thermophila (strain SB210) TaxID=312017 RepID=W7XIL1_TETTS|nr:hypothetical protein TTHERM_000227308 [Tetrahymena thermophila SB210]EWS74741.1 hypothetical protein TTHERM_000227308 [Tetrahymena thermophila SB210]|eukprot:XP_012652742.1 hypothetical protein TTHERM_000227308 [Tetrahymena thermophila SB210]
MTISNMKYNKVLQQILRLFQKYKSNLYQQSRVEINSFMDNFNSKFMNDQKEKISRNIKLLKFQEMEKQYEQLIQTLKLMGEFNEIFLLKDWNFQSKIENLKEVIRKLILSLHDQQELKYLLNLIQRLNEAQKLYPDFSETFQQEITYSLQKVNSDFEQYEKSIKNKIKNKDILTDLEYLKDFAQKAEDIESKIQQKLFRNLKIIDQQRI